MENFERLKSQKERMLQKQQIFSEGLSESVENLVQEIIQRANVSRPRAEAMAAYLIREWLMDLVTDEHDHVLDVMAEAQQAVLDSL